jgi:predicted Zn-ribbon and HTH transcriptional regulator
MAGEDHPRWRGGVRIKRGYRFIHAPGNPMADRYNYVAEHRLVAAEKIGRPLTSEEHVHHINHDKLDNRPENLMIVDRAQHLIEHKRGRPPGWVTRPDGCIDCGTKDRPHRANGRCPACHQRWWLTTESGIQYKARVRAARKAA